MTANPSATTRATFIRAVNEDSKPYYARLILSPQSTLDQLTANISLVSSSSFTATNITIVNGVVISNLTSWIEVEPTSEISAVLSAYFPSTGRSATLYMLLEYSTLPAGGGACAHYPIELNLNAASVSVSSSTTYPTEPETNGTEEALEIDSIDEIPEEPGSSTRES